MFHPSISLIRNKLLRALSPEDLHLLHPHLDPVSLQVRDVLVEPNEPIEHVYFLEQGIASIVAISPGDQRIEVGHVGREGLTGTTVLLHVDRSPQLTFVQVAGSALRMKSSDLLEAIGASTTLNAQLLRYLHTVTVQSNYTALANGRFNIGQRLARWLLMCRDRVDSDDIPLTHEFLSLMLGVRRPGVTEHLQLLEGEHIIKSTRGQVVLLDRARLEEKAADCYGVPEAEYARLFPSQAS
jgi:CRP-like cAMP-binding protein